MILTLINLYAYINNLTRNTLLEDKIYCNVSIYDDLNSDTPIEFSENLTNGTYYIKSNYVDNKTI